MPYDYWQMEEPEGATHTKQAFVFDGWSHKPLVVDRKPTSQAMPRHDSLVMASSTTSSDN